MLGSHPTKSIYLSIPPVQSKIASLSLLSFRSQRRSYYVSCPVCLASRQANTGTHTGWRIKNGPGGTVLLRLAINGISHFVFRALQAQTKSAPASARLALEPQTMLSHCWVLIPQNLFICQYTKNGPGGTRTHDQLIKSQLLYQLSYKSIYFDIFILSPKFYFAILFKH